MIKNKIISKINFKQEFKMKLTLIALALLSSILLSFINPSESECCYVPIKCTVGSTTTKRCYDCTEATSYCGKGKCNAFGCSCDGGCRQGDSTLACWNIASGCKMTGFYESTAPQDIFKAIDTDSDGRVSFTEAKEYIIQNRPTNANIEEELLKLDTNNDGFLSLNEIDGY